MGDRACAEGEGEQRERALAEWVGVSSVGKGEQRERGQAE